MFQKDKSFTRSGKLGGAVVLAMAFSLSCGFGQIYMDTNGATAGFGNLNGATWSASGTNWTTNVAGSISTFAWDNTSGTTVFDASGGVASAVTLGSNFTVSGLSLVGSINVTFSGAGIVTTNGEVNIAAGRTLSMATDVNAGLTGNFTKKGDGALDYISGKASAILGSSTITLEAGQINLRPSHISSYLTSFVVNGGVLFNTQSNGFYALDTLNGTGGSIQFNEASTTAGSLTVNSGSYSGTILKRATGSGVISFSKYSPGTFTMGGSSNTYTGANTISGGTLEVVKLANGGVVSSIGESTNVAANLLLANATTFRYIGTGDSTDRLFTISGTAAGDAATLESSGSGAVAFTNTGTLGFGTANQTRTLILGGTNTGNNVLAATLTNNGTAALSLTKNNAGKWSLSGNNTYTGTTTVNAGTLLVSGAGSINLTSVIAVNGSGSKFRYDSSTGLDRNVTLATGGGLYHNGSTNYSGTLTWTNGTLGGTNWNGTLGGLTVGANQILSPGNSVGTATSTSQTWASQGAFNFEVNKANGTAGLTAGGWDLLNLSSTLSISATSGSKFTINLISLGLDNLPGAADSFVDSTNYKWLFADATGAISGFSADKFAINTGSFTNPFTGTFGVALGDAPGIGGDNSQLYLTYTIPEPNTALLLGFGLATVLLRRRRV